MENETDSASTFNNAFAYTTDDLLKNVTFSFTKCAPFKLYHYVSLKKLSNGIIDKYIDESVFVELQKLNFKIDRLINYITNIFDYEFVVLNHDLSVVHVLNAATKEKIGQFNVSLNNNDINVIIITVTPF
ncbi:ac26 [Oxyplax ochracea nucleopolyhedrovirus]|uniref:Ac26 n=1 Tax=Oxyplax ochracea nucleopolyhedrovirus TaxID=2083176 RepID=A0A2L0WU76_9ABAC|nr:ac26 [Oxyplax ochracea nucleopolyhedrovirus]AVA31207.1 ac26 [Oxyplax ochracea nucleopolyhedrovirus]